MPTNASKTAKVAATADVSRAPVQGARGQCAVPTEKEVEEGLARMRPEVHKAFEESLEQYSEAYKKLADM